MAQQQGSEGNQDVTDPEIEVNLRVLGDGTTDANVYQGSPVVVEGTLIIPVWWKRKPVILSILLAAIIAVVVLIVLVSTSQSVTIEQQQEEKDIEVPIEEEWVPLVPDMTNATIKALEDPFSQQSQAYEWIAKDPDWDTYESWRKQQRFAMMCFFFAFEGSGSFLDRRFRPSHYSHECDWLVSFDSCQGNDRGEINIIGLVPNDDISFQGTVPPEIAFLSNLEAIEFSGGLDLHPLEDVFSLDAINSLPPIKSLKFRDCRLGGSIPSTLGLVTSLTLLELPSSRLESTIPSQLGLLSDLSTLSLSSNGLTGSIPGEIGELSFLRNLDIRNNPDLESSMPSGFCRDDRTPLESLVTDWCSNPAECCGS